MADNSATYRQIFEYCNRDYQAYSIRHRIYCVPVDNAEEERLHKQHTLMQLILRYRLMIPPNISEVPDTVLDCGYGRGSWAVTFAETYPDSEVNAIDVYPAVIDGPGNLRLGICNLNDGAREWGFPPNYFDLINSRFLAPGIDKTRWRSYVQDLARLLRRNGWLQMIEWGYLIQSDSGMLHEHSYCRRWNDLYRQALDDTKDLRVGQRMRELMQRVGLRDIHTFQYPVPIGPWKEGWEDIGRLHQSVVSESLESLTLWTFTRERGFTQQQVENLANQCRAEMNTTGWKLYMQLYIGYGRKP